MTLESRGATKDQFAIVSKVGLVVKLLGGRMMINNVSTWVEPATFTLVNNATNYIYVNMQGVLVSSTSPTPLNGFDLWKVVTSGGAIVGGIDDQRAMPRISEHTKFQTDANWLATGSFNADTGWTNLDLSSVAPAGATGVVIGIAVADSGTPGSSVWTGVRKPGETEISRQGRVYPQVTGLYVCGTLVVGMDANRRIQYRVLPSGTSTAYLRLMGWIFGG